MKEVKKGKWYRFKLTEEWHSSIPNNVRFAGNYIIIFPDGNVYIGESSDIHRRLLEHISMARYSSCWKTRWGNYPKMQIAIRKEKSSFERKMLECRFINRLKPSLNKVSGVWGKYGK